MWGTKTTYNMWDGKTNYEYNTHSLKMHQNTDNLWGTKTTCNIEDGKANYEYNTHSLDMH